MSKKRVRRRLRKSTGREAPILNVAGPEAKKHSREDEAEREISAVLDKRVSKSKRKAGGHVKEAGNSLGTNKPESPKKIRKRRKKLHAELAAFDVAEETEATCLSEHDESEGILKKAAKKSKLNGVSSGVAWKKQKLSLGKKTERLVLSKAPRKKSIMKNKGGFTVVSRPSEEVTKKKNGCALPAKADNEASNVSLGLRKQETPKKRREQMSNGVPEAVKAESPNRVAVTGTEMTIKKRVPLITLTKKLEAKGPVFSVKPDAGTSVVTQNAETERNQFQVSTPTATFFRKCLGKVQSEKTNRLKRMAPPEKLSLSFQGEKKVNFALSRNKSQDPREYFETLKNSPEIPFDASRKPVQGVLKTKSQTPTGVKIQRRSKASDFF